MPMQVKPNRAFDEFRRRIKDSIFQPWKGTIYRVSTLKYADPRVFLFGGGSHQYGGRWNTVGSFRAVYGSVDAIVALSEQQASAQYSNLPYPFRETRLIVAVEVDLSRVADLTSEETLQMLDVTEKELHQEDWRKVQEQGHESLTQALGRALFEAKAEGLIAHSARVKNGINFAYFPQNKIPSSKVRPWQAQELQIFGIG